MAVHGMGPRALLNRTTKEAGGHLGQTPFSLETLPAHVQTPPSHPHLTGNLCSLLSCCPGPALLQESQLSWVGHLFLHTHPTAQAVGMQSAPTAHQAPREGPP